MHDPGFGDHMYIETAAEEAMGALVSDLCEWERLNIEPGERGDVSFIVTDRKQRVMCGREPGRFVLSFVDASMDGAVYLSLAAASEMAARLALESSEQAPFQATSYRIYAGARANQIREMLGQLADQAIAAGAVPSINPAEPAEPDTADLVRQRKYELDPEAWQSYSGKTRDYKRKIELRRASSTERARLDVQAGWRPSAGPAVPVAAAVPGLAPAEKRWTAHTLPKFPPVTVAAPSQASDEDCEP